MHNIPQSGESANVIKERNNARMLEDVARLGEQPVVLCLDTNQHESAVLDEAIQSGRYIDVAKKLAGREGPDPTWSQDLKWDKISRGSGKTRPDKVIVNRVAWDMIKNFRLRRESRIPGHIPIEIELDAEMISEEQTILKHPNKLNVDKMELCQRR